MNLTEKYGKWACVAGAAEGLGKAFAEGLAKRGFHLILIDHKKEVLADTTVTLQNRYQVEITSLSLELGNRDSIEPIIKSMNEKACRFLVYNAAYGPVKPFLSNTTEELDFYLKVNMETPIQLIHKLTQIHDKAPLGIMLVSSLAGWRGTQLVVPYAATKAWTWNLAEGLYYEFQDTNLAISVCCPGGTDTPNFQSTNPKMTLFSPKAMSPEKVADEALRKFGKKLFIFPGFSNKLAHFILNRVLPRKIASGIHNHTMKKLYG